MKYERGAIAKVNQELIDRPLVHYSIDWTKLRTVVDVIELLRGLDFHFHYPEGMEPPPHLAPYLIRESAPVKAPQN